MTDLASDLITHLDSLEWRAGGRGRTSHGFTTPPAAREPARCGFPPPWRGGWIGGDPANRERVAALPRCKLCVARFAADQGQTVQGQA